MLSGESGVGKTYLLETLLKEHLEKKDYNGIKWTHIYINNYTDIKGIIKDKLYRTDSALNLSDNGLLETDPNTNLIFIFDQAERMFMNKADKDFLKKFIENNINSSFITIILSIRKDMYYNTGFFEDFIPNPYHCIDLKGIDLSENEREIKKSIEGILSYSPENNNPHSSNISCQAIVNEIENDGFVLPIIYKMVCTHLKKRGIDVLSSSEFHERYNGSTEGLIKAFFNDCFDQAGFERHIFIQIACALSLGRKNNKALTEDDIAE